MAINSSLAAQPNPNVRKVVQIEAARRRQVPFRRYDLKRVDGQLMLVRNEIDRAFDLAMSEVCGIELDPDVGRNVSRLDRVGRPAILIILAPGRPRRALQKWVSSCLKI